jgi:ABC-type glycerol-3-phosphate transport system substrate-binding protein
MNIRTLILLIVLGLPAAGLLTLGPRGKYDVPPGRTVVRYWEKWSGVEARAMQDVVARFNATVGAEHGIWVEYNAISNVDQRLLVATAGGDPPDVAGLFDYIVSQFADQGALLPLDDWVREAEIDATAFKPIWWDIGVYEGTLYALPSPPYTIALYYNKQLFRGAGLDPQCPPATIAELDEYARKLTRWETGRDGQPKIVQMGFTTSPAMLGWWHWVWPCFFDARPWDGRQFHLSTPECRAAYRWVAAQRAELGAEAALTFEATAGAIEGPQNPFLSGRLAMVFQGPWLSNWAMTYAPDLDYGVAPFPSLTRERENVFASSDVFVIPHGARHPREAMVFLKYVLRQDVMEALCQAHGKVSPFRTPGPDFYASHPNPYIRVFDELASSADAFGYPKMPMFQQATAELLNLLNTVLRGSNPDAAVDAAQRKIDGLVNEYWQMAAKRHTAVQAGS